MVFGQSREAVSIIFSLNLQTVRSHPGKILSNIARSVLDDIAEEEEENIRKTTPAPSIAPETKTDIIKELEKLIKTVEEKPSIEKVDVACENKTACAQLKKENLVLKKPEISRSWILKPAYPCDEIDEPARLCFLDRNLGNTVTFVLATPIPKSVGRIKVEWLQRFHTKDPKLIKTYAINPRDSPWNMVIGSGGHELRVSPITETDIFPNHFTAVVHYQYGKPTRKLNFIIRKIPIDVGLVYPGATMTLHVPTFISLPSEGMTFKWELNREFSSLPSNMRPSPSGASLRISELRKEQEGIVSCSVYTNIGVQATHIKFNIRQVEKDNNKLVFIATRPTHQPFPLLKMKRSETVTPLNKKRQTSKKRQAAVLSDAIDQLDKQSLEQILSHIPDFKKLLTENNYMDRERKKRSLQSDDSSVYFMDSVGEQTVTNINADFNFEPILRGPLYLPRYLNKRQDDEDLSPPTNIKENENEFEDRLDELQNQIESATPKEKSNFDKEEFEYFEQEGMDVETPTPRPTKALSFLERHRQAILARLRGSDLKRKQIKIVPKKITCVTTETPATMIDIEEEPTLPPIPERDKLSMLLSQCDRDSECSMNAVCVRPMKKKPGFCRCLPKFEGNGIFCWEGGKWMI
ncbi:hypothetical protein HNY73_007561 [Argiope bruennichi]|uniref:Uncharacterized protein n=1 Tax=Argiope bruennichi TaxID=94029 RepID=A0A8T0FGW3_ARGBR|nr:hypothetical protein HNY73_007561 [Argiope bruennichi]